MIPSISPLERHTFVFCSNRLPRISSAAFIAWAAFCGVSSARPAEVQTVDGGVVCLRPFELREGIVAANRNDQAWLRELGCVRLSGGIRAVLIDPNAAPAAPWQVRLYPPGKPDGITGWGYAPSFQTRDGKPFWPVGR